MSYVPKKYIIVENTKLREYDDLSIPLSQLINKEAYLVVEKQLASYVLSINNILLYISDIDISSSLTDAFTSMLNDTFVQRFINNHIPTTMQSGYYQNRIKVFNPISYKNYHVDYTSRDMMESVNDIHRKGFLDDLVITSNTDLTNSLVAVNGVFHRTSIVNDKLYVLDGFRSMRLCGRKDVTIVDTSELGGHSVIPLTSTNLVQTDYNDWAVITLPTSIVDKTIFLVIDGYFYHLENDIISIIDPTHIKVKTNLLPLIQQFRHNPRTVYTEDLLGDNAIQSSRKYSDDYDALFLNNRSVPSSVFKTLEFQKSRLTNYHSFIVMVNSSKLYTVDTEVQSTGTPRLYYDYSNAPLSGMLSYGCGLCPSYLIHNETGGRRQIFVSEQDGYTDWELDSHNPQFIPFLTPNQYKSANLKARFIDYIKS